LAYPPWSLLPTRVKFRPMKVNEMDNVFKGRRHISSGGP
jgi:hypothetical protein